MYTTSQTIRFPNVKTPCVNVEKKRLLGIELAPPPAADITRVDVFVPAENPHTGVKYAFCRANKRVAGLRARVQRALQVFYRRIPRVEHTVFVITRFVSRQEFK